MHRLQQLTWLAAIPLLLLSACGADADSPGTGGMTKGENARLEAAAERLDQRPASPAAQRSAEVEAQVRAGIEAEHARNP